MSRSKESAAAIKAVWMEGYREGYRRGLVVPKPPLHISTEDLRSVYAHHCGCPECPAHGAEVKERKADE